ncbi:MAG: succinate dehydrogenase assembly factor 2 [Chromatiales bacterium]|jgi:antitoxin CptB
MELPTAQQLRWQCRRGMLELDLIFEEFLDQHYEQLSEPLQRDFVELLNYADQDLQQWLLGKSSPADKNMLNIIERILQH